MYTKMRRRASRQGSLGGSHDLRATARTGHHHPRLDEEAADSPSPAPDAAAAAAAAEGTQPEADARAPSLGVNDTLYSFKLLDALRTGDPEALQPFLLRARRISRSARPKRSNTTGSSAAPADREPGAHPTPEVTELTSPLHLAMRCAEDTTIARMLMYQDLDVNAQEVQHGNTPLHLASMCGRSDAIKQLLERRDIDDLIRNFAGQEPMEVAASPAIASLFQVSRAELNASFIRALAVYENSAQQGGPKVTELLMLNRYRAIDLNASSPETGGTLLHAAVRYKDTAMIELAAQKGADVFAGDRQGRPCLEVTKDERLRALLRQLGNTNPGLLLTGASAAPMKPPAFKGWLGKWTNLAGRYKPRWFVLENGALSYYHSPSDQGRQVRGSINLQFATVKADSSDPLRFEVLSEPGKKGVVDSKLFLRGSHPAERARWVQLLFQTQAYYRAKPQAAGEHTHHLEPGTAAQALTPVSTSSHVLPSPISGAGSLAPTNTTSSGAASTTAAQGSSTTSPPIVVPKPRIAQVANGEDDWSISYAARAAQGSPQSPVDNIAHGQDVNISAPIRPASTTGNRLSRIASSITSRVKTPSRISSPIGFTSLAGAPGDGRATGVNRTMTPLSKYATSAVSYNGTDQTPPHAAAECDDASLLYGEDHGSTMTGDMYGKPNSSNPKLALHELPMDNEYSLLSNSLTTRAELAKALAELMVDRCASGTEVLHDDDGGLVSDGGPVDTLSTRLAMRDDLISIVDLLAQYQSVVERREAYLRRRYQQEISAKLLWEENLQALAKQYEDMERNLARLTDDGAQKRRTIKELRGQLALRTPHPSATPSNAAEDSRDMSTATATTETPKASMERQAGTGPSLTTAGIAGAEAAQAVALQQIRDEEDEESDSEDEFYEAVDRGTLTNVTVESQLTERPNVRKHIDPRLVHMEGVKPYEHMRHEMPIGRDVRPSVSLWGVLKNNIGKDLTKISFPVSFNEPTSMLQRMAEDMEFSECLDAASRSEDSTKRIAYVAAFAMSNYSSTIGRIAKPFNPMLGETFEYVSVDKEYRYLSEQVSHHPPISACFAESPGWQYFGCVDAKSKFLGRTFEIRPTGVAHANLKIPEAWAKASWNKDKLASAKLQPSLMDVPGPPMLLEHYTWNKVTTCVSGFLIGQTTIDHYGDMEVTNHATGDRCVLTFKQRGWRSKDAYGIKGAVYDAQGNLRWEIAGRWNSQLVARRIGTAGGELDPDHAVRTDAPIGAKPEEKAQYLLLWKNSEKPPSPFNLPPFAITLNDLPKGLHLWLPPSDCRLRPDLRAFETGRFDEANTLKIELEELQRATRRKREAGEVPPHKPRWFARTLDPDSNDTLWAPHKERVKPIRFSDSDSGAKGNAETEKDQGSDSLVPEVPTYWITRDKVGGERLQAGSEDVAQWPDVEHVFGQLEVK